jgi:hypothetical protein
MESIRLEGAVWWITLEPESGVWMTNKNALNQVLPPDTTSE